jgi:hypothetical protein
MVPPQSLRNVHRLSGKITSEITTLSDLCGNAVDPHTLYRATDFDGVLANANIPDAATAKKIKDSLVRLKSLETERVQVFGDMDRLVRNRLDVMQRAGNYNETATGRAARVREGLDLLQFEGQSQDGSGRRINFDEPDSVYGDAILRAHDIGDPPYTPVQLRQKRQILLEHFTEDQVDTLIRTRIAGKKPTPNTYPPPPPPPRGKPYSKVSVDRTDLVSGLDTPVYELSLDGKKYRVADGTYVRLSSPGRSARGAEIPEGEYQIEFVATQGQAGKTEYQMALRPLNPEDVGGSYSIDFNKTRWKVMPDQVGMMKKNYQKPIAEKSATATTQNLVDVDSDDIFSTKRYESDRKDIASYDESKQVVSGIPEQKLKVDPAKVEAHVSSVRSAKRAELEKKTSQFVETDRTKTMPTPAPFALQPNQRVWVCQGVQTDAGAVIFNTKSQARLVSGPAIVRKQKGKFVLMQYGGSEADPQILTVEITPEIKKHLAIPKDLHKESVMRLSNRGNGWKLRMNFNAFNEQLHKMVFRELTYLHQRGMIDDWKFFHGGEMADGKTSTIYVGDARKAKIVTDYLESLFSDALWQHKNADDIEFGTYMTGRFEVSETPEVDQYIKKPVAASSGLSSPMEVAYSARFKQWFMEQKLQKIDEYFAEMYGPFYNGAFNDLPNLPSHLSVPQTSKTTPKPPPPPRRK